MNPRLGLCLLAIVASCLFASAETPSVERWDVFELTLCGPSAGNPYIETELSASFTQGERSVTVTGFYDGDGNYRVRFMPESTGTWHYRTSSNRAELQGREGSFLATPPTGKNHGLVRVAREFHFAYSDGTPFRELGTTCYSWAHAGDDKEALTLKTLAGSPFNKLRMCVFPQDLLGEQVTRFPFEGHPPRAWDTQRFNPAYFRHLEQRILQLRDLGIEADLILFHPYDKVWGFSTMDSATDERTLRYLISRFAAFRNVWWSLANEYDFIRQKSEADWDRLFRVVQGSDPYGHLRSIHNGFRLYNHNQPWVTHVSLQQGAAVLDNERAVIYRDVYRKPVVFDEVKYEGDSQRRWGQLKPEELVLRFWQGTLAGSYVGHGEIFGDAADSWLASGGTLRGQSVRRLAFLKKILEEGPAEGLEPLDKWQERRMAGKAGSYYLVYLGDKTPSSWPLVLPKENLSGEAEFAVEVIDTWDMTIMRLPGTYLLKPSGSYDYVDSQSRSIPLPGRPYQAIRLIRVGKSAPVQASQTNVEP